MARFLRGAGAAFCLYLCSARITPIRANIAVQTMLVKTIEVCVVEGAYDIAANYFKATGGIPQDPDEPKWRMKLLYRYPFKAAFGNFLAKNSAGEVQGTKSDHLR